MRVDLIRAAGNEMDRLRAGNVQPPEPLTSALLEKALGNKVQKCELWLVKWNNRIYRVELADGTSLVAKQICTQTEAELVQEYDHLSALSQLAFPGFRVPRPVALLPGLRTSLVEFAPGQSIQAILWERQADQTLPRACGLAGQVLARLHTAWTNNVQPVPADAIFQDLTEMPSGFSSGERRTVHRALERLASQQVAVGQPYLDYNPRNVLYHEGTLALIDPPAERWEGLLLWDFSTFRVDLRRELWKHTVGRPWRCRHALVEKSLTAFERGYVTGSPPPHPKTMVPPLLVGLLELQRVGQLMVQRRAHLQMVLHQQNPLPRSSHRLRGVALALLSLALLEAQKRWLIHQMARALA